MLKYVADRPAKYSQPYKNQWTPESLATFMSHWFAQGKLKKMHNNFSWRFEFAKPKEHNIDPWLAKIMY